MAIHLTCPGCGLHIDAPETAAGRSGKCRQCGVTVVIPFVAPAAPSTLPAADPGPAFAAFAGPTTAPSAPTPAIFRFHCPSCNCAYDVPQADARKKFNCQKCGQRIQIPAPPPPPQNKTVLGKLPGQGEIVETQALPPPPPSPFEEDREPRNHGQERSDRRRAANDDDYEERGGRHSHRREGGTGMAVTGLVLGIIGSVFSLTCVGWFLGVLLGILAAIFSGIGLANAAKTQQGKGMAIAGLVLSIVAILMPFFWFVIFSALFR